MRINKFLATSGIASRRASDELIKDGVVKINGRICSPGDDVDLSSDTVTVNGKLVNVVKKYDYYIMNKPKGCVCTVKDDKGRKTVMDLLPPKIKRLFPVGRLDYDTEGLLILTNDGDLINQLTHPSIEIPKVYRVVAEGKVTLENMQTMAKGIEIEKGQIAYADSQILEYEGKNTVLEIILYQGLNRQIRKMLDYVGHPVISLKRISCANIDLAGLKRGQFKYLKPKQIADLKNYIKKIEKLSKPQ